METKDKIIAKLHSHPIYFFGMYFFGILLFGIGFFIYPLLSVAGFFVVVLTEVSRISENFFVMDSGVGREYRLLSTSRKFIEFDQRYS